MFPVLATTLPFPIVVAIALGQFLRTGRGRKPYAVGIAVISVILGDVSTSGFDGHVAISGCLSMSHLCVDTFFDFGVVKK